MKEIKIGLIGCGYIGRCHAIAYAQAPTVFSLKGKLVREMIAEMSYELAKDKAQAFGFNRATGEWYDVVSDADIDVVDICVPNFLHKEVALAAIRNGKHVYCEKPLALTTSDAVEMVDAANKAGVKTLVGFNYMRNPAAQLAKQIIENGEIGEIVHFYGTHNEDYLANAQTPIDWHCLKNLAGLGALGDLAAHIVNMAHYLLGGIKEVSGDMATMIPERHDPKNPNKFCKVENEDQASALIRFESGVMGVIETSRIASGCKMGLTFVVTGTKGAIAYTQERMAELKVYSHNDSASRQGFKTILIGPEHPDYASFCVSAGHGFGFNDQKTIEIRELINGIAAGDPMWPDFTEGLRVSKVVDAIAQSARERRWVTL